MSNTSLIIKVMGEALLSRFRPSIKHLILHVTNRCNMRCKHCFVNFDKIEEELTLNEIKSLSKKFSGLIWLDIGGGEPLLRDDLEEIIPLFRFEELSIPTNGWETERSVEKLKKIHSMASGKLIVTLSLDGMPKTHNEIRCPMSFERTVQTFNSLRKIKGIRIKFNTVLCEKNYDDIINLMHFVKDLRVDFHSILMLRGITRDPSMRLPAIEKIRALEKDIYQIQQAYNYGRTGILSIIQRNYQAYKKDLCLKIMQEKKQIIPCLAGTSHLVIWPEGSMSPCELLPPIGSIRERGLEELLNGEEIKKIISSIKSGNCFCTHDCNMIENTLLNPKSYLKLLR